MIRADSVKVTQSLFQETEGGAIPTSALQLKVKMTNKATAAVAFKRWHYFGDKGFLSTFNFGVYYQNKFLGAITYGIPNARNIKGLYDSYSQKNWLELTRLALSDVCPKNSESRVIAVTLKMLKKYRPNLVGVITYADTQQGHTGTIYRASNFNYIGLTAPKTDLFINGKPVGKIKGVKYSQIKGQWLPRSQKHLFVKIFR